MWTQFHLYKILICLLLCNFSFCQIQINTNWGLCTLYNKSSSITNIELENIINAKINKLNIFFNCNIKKPFSVYIYTNQKNDVKINSPHWEYSLGITYANSDKIIVKDRAVSHISLNKFKQVIEHELNHLLINRIDNKKSIPRWFKEGLAMHISGEINIKHKLIVVNNMFKNKLLNLNELTSFNNFNKNNFNLAYAQSAVYVESLQHLFQKNIFSNIIQYIRYGDSFENAIYKSTGMKLFSLEEHIKKFIKTKYWWLKLVNFSDYLFLLMPLLLVIGFIIKKHHNKQKIKKWELEEELLEQEI